MTYKSQKCIGILATLMLGSHYLAIRHERYDSSFVADRGTFQKCQVWIRCDTSRCVLIRFAMLGIDLITICQFQVSHL